MQIRNTDIYKTNTVRGRLAELGLTTLEERRHRADMAMANKILTHRHGHRGGQVHQDSSRHVKKTSKWDTGGWTSGATFSQSEWPSHETSEVKNTGTKWELWKVLKTLTRSIAGTLALCGPRVNCPASLDTRPSTGSRASRDNDAGCPLSGHEGWSDKYYYR